MKKTHKTGKLISILEAVDNDDLMIITTQGVMIRQPVENIRTIGRNTQGVRLLRLDDGATISSVTKVIKDEVGAVDEDDNLNTDEEQESSSPTPPQ